MNRSAIILAALQLALEANASVRPPGHVWELSDDHFVSVVGWILDGLPYERIAKLCKKELALPPAKAPSKSGISRFWSGFASFYLVAKRRSQVATARTLEKEIAETPQDFDAATRDAVRRLALDLATSEGANPKDVKALMMLVLKTRDQDLAERRVQLLEKREKDTRDVLTDESLTPADREARMKQLFGITS